MSGLSRIAKIQNLGEQQSIGNRDRLQFLANKFSIVEPRPELKARALGRILVE